MRTVIAGTLLAAALAVPAGAAAAPKHRSTRLVVMRLHGKVTNATAVDNPASAAGHVLIFTENLFNAGGRRVGHDAATCTSLFDGHSSLCTGLYVLRGGQVTVTLLQPGPRGTYSQAVTGGTGRYEQARGTVVVHQHASGVDRFVFRLRLPARG